MQISGDGNRENKISVGRGRDGRRDIRAGCLFYAMPRDTRTLAPMSSPLYYPPDWRF